ncbi:MAG: hypothetical protein FJ290_33255, partial [Planctomycetes bacterium]|nr:hypothetical protein [Planctomycetota bacterium]
MSEARDTMRKTRREFMVASGAAALSAGALGSVRAARGAEAPPPKPLLEPPAQQIKKCSLRVVWVGKEAAAAEAASLTKALDATAKKLDFAVDYGQPGAAPPDGQLIVALNGQKNDALAEAAKGATTPAVVLCPRGQGPAP